MEDISAVGDTYDGVVTRLPRLDPRDGRREGEPKRQEAEYLLLMAILPCLLGPKIYVLAEQFLTATASARNSTPWTKSPAPPSALTARVTSRCHSQSIWSRRRLSTQIDFPGQDGLSNHRPSGRPRPPFSWERGKQTASGALFFVVERRNK
jgi:hypothetical protein